MSRPPTNRAGVPCLSRLSRTLPRLATGLLAALFLALPTRAETLTGRSVNGVVELFTSQGCASCPPADDVLTGFAADENLLALSYHVDYWDYIGWRDPLAAPRNAERQRAYTNALRQRTVYTPQIVVNGSRDVAANPEAIRDALAADALPRRAAGLLHLRRDGSTLHVTADAPQASLPEAHAVLILVTYRRSTETAVERGENEGMRLVNTHAVRDWQIVGKMMGKTVELDMPLASLRGTDTDPTECAILLQAMEEDGTPGPILAAAKIGF